LLFALVSLLLDTQPPEINDQTDRKSGHPIDKDISKTNKHSPVQKLYTQPLQVLR
jgi:hypothetical protein